MDGKYNHARKKQQAHRKKRIPHHHLLSPQFSILLLLFLSICFTSCQQESPLDLSEIEQVSGPSAFIFGDCRGGYQIFRRFVSIMTNVEPAPEMVVMAGDLIAVPGSLFQWSAFFYEIDPLAHITDLYPIPGNHDVADYTSQQTMLQVFHMNRLYYSRWWQGIWWIFLDSEEPGSIGGIGEMQRIWLETQLTQVPKNTKHIVVVVHRPLFPITSHGALWDRDYYHQLFVRAGVSVVFNGHEHLFGMQQKDGVYYVSSGGAGSPLNEGFPGSFYHIIRLVVQQHSLLFQVIEPNATVHETFTVQSTRGNDQRSNPAVPLQQINDFGTLRR